MASNYYVHAGTQATGYFVAVEGEMWGPYALKAAKDFARIGSQKGRRARAITRSTHGPVVRIYKKGERTFPVTASDLRGLTQVEHPAELRQLWMTRAPKPKPKAKPKSKPKAKARKNPGLTMVKLETHGGPLVYRIHIAGEDVGSIIYTGRDWIASVDKDWMISTQKSRGAAAQFVSGRWEELQLERARPKPRAR